MENERIKEIEEAIADIKSRWPAHSVKPEMWQQLEELEEKLELAKVEQTKKSSNNRNQF
ncbi:histidine kinase [Chloroflexota bacterium]